MIEVVKNRFEEQEQDQDQQQGWNQMNSVNNKLTL